jgi:hypothetical protein
MRNAQTLFMGLPTAAMAVATLSACDQPGASSSAPASGNVSNSNSLQPDAEQSFLNSRELSPEDSAKEKGAPNSVVLAQDDWDIRAKECRSLYKWKKFDGWTGRVESLDGRSRSIKVTVSLNNNGHKAFYTTLYGTISKSSPLYKVVINLHEGEMSGSPVRVSGAFAFPRPQRSLDDYSSDNVERQKALGFCSGSSDFPVTFTSVQLLPDAPGGTN